MESGRLRWRIPRWTGTGLPANSLQKRVVTDLDGARRSCVRAARGPSGHRFFPCINRRNRRTFVLRRGAHLGTMAARSADSGSAALRPAQRERKRRVSGRAGHRIDAPPADVDYPPGNLRLNNPFRRRGYGSVLWKRLEKIGEARSGEACAATAKAPPHEPSALPRRSS
jgi:hypothetical protein